MAKMTINQVRVRLGKLFTIVTEREFNEVYEMLVPQFKNNAPDVLACFEDACIEYIKLIAENLSNPTKIADINKQVAQPVIFCMGLKYHFITTALVNDSQSKEIIMPDDDKEFFIKMFTSYLNDFLLHQ